MTDTNIELTVNDLAVVRNALEIAISAGAYKPQQLVGVGTIYEKLDMFLQAVAANQQQSAPADDANTEAESANSEVGE